MNRTLPNPFPGVIGQPVQINTPKKTHKKKLSKGIPAGTNGTLLAVALDESGSMDSCLDATIEGFNEFMSGQKKETGQCYLKVNKFEGGNVRDLWGFEDIHKAPKMSTELYQPAGMTNLLDAIGQTIEEVDEYLKGMKKKDRPSVIFMIMTDGHENSSCRFTNDDIKQLVEMREDKNWGFQFFGANIDAFAEGGKFGMTGANTIQYNTENMGATMAVASSATSRLRKSYAGGATTRSLMSESFYSDEERNSALGE